MTLFRHHYLNYRVLLQPCTQQQSEKDKNYGKVNEGALILQFKFIRIMFACSQKYSIEIVIKFTFEYKERGIHIIVRPDLLRNYR